MKPKYTVIIYTPQELSQSSFIQTGLFELERVGFIKVKVKISLTKKIGRIKVIDENVIYSNKQASPKTSYYKLINNITNEQFTFATDLYDFANQFSLYALKNCDFVFKRNYESKFVSILPTEFQKKLFSMSLTFKVLSDNKHSDSLFLMGLIFNNLYLNIKYDRNLFIRLYNCFVTQKAHWKSVKRSSLLSKFGFTVKLENATIFFQTRCFNNEEQEDIKAIHQQRYRIIRLLKKTYPKQFQGGFISSKISNLIYNDALSNIPSKQELYLNALKKAKIVIYTRGLANSPAWKMAEYLSQGKVIIAESLTAELSVPLVHGKEVLFFNTDEELINNINSVLNNELLAKELSKSARLYFEKHVHPLKSVKNMLDFMNSNFSTLN